MSEINSKKIEKDIMNVVLRTLLEVAGIILLGCMGKLIMLELSSGMLIEKRSKSQNTMLLRQRRMLYLLSARVNIEAGR